MQFLVIARDGADEGAQGRRMAARPAHFERLPAMLEAGEVLMGGAMLDDAGRMIGSSLLVDFPDRAALDRWLEREPYVTGDVWLDIEVVPFRLAVSGAIDKAAAGR
ncbi:MAG TPA: YciI family protein [Aliidongia sp.]|nr:YciI family protein [Aliidongia sp.]